MVLPPTIESLPVGSILDAQDYLGVWHLAIVIDEKEPDSKQFGKSKGDLQRILGKD